MPFFTPRLGIDLGTANTLVFVPGQGVVLNEPSVVAVSKNDNSIVAVGAEAREMVGRTPDTIVAYRPMKDGVIADYRVTEAMLSYHIQKTLGRWNIWKPEVLVSVPAGVTSTQRRAVVEAAINAGARRAYVVKEPILAAIGAGIPIHEPQGYMVVDMGGGTTDVAVIALGGIVACASVKCAGTRLDGAIIDYMRRSHNLVIGEKTAEEVKMQIGSAMKVEEPDEMEVKGRDVVTGLPRVVRVTGNDVVKGIKRELREMIGAIKDVLHDTPPELASDIIDRGIVMTGGTSQLKNLPDLVLAQTGVPATLADEALFCVVKGTGIALSHLESYRKEGGRF